MSGIMNIINVCQVEKVLKKTTTIEIYEHTNTCINNV